MNKFLIIPLLGMLSTSVFSAPIDIEAGDFKKNVELINEPIETHSVSTGDQYAKTTMVSIPTNLKATGFDFSFVAGTNMILNSKISYRPRTELDVFEFSCLAISDDIDSTPKVIHCLREKDGEDKGTKTAKQPNASIDYKAMMLKTEKIELAPGMKLVSFDFNMDKEEPLKYTTVPMTSTDKPVIYSFTRISTNYEQWSGKHGFIIREHR